MDQLTLSSGASVDAKGVLVEGTLRATLATVIPVRPHYEGLAPIFDHVVVAVAIPRHALACAPPFPALTDGILKLGAYLTTTATVLNVCPYRHLASVVLTLVAIFEVLLAAISTHSIGAHWSGIGRAVALDTAVTAVLDITLHGRLAAATISTVLVTGRTAGVHVTGAYGADY